LKGFRQYEDDRGSGAIEEVAVAKVIAFSIPNTFRKPLKVVPDFQLGEVIEFCPQTKKSA